MNPPRFFTSCLMVVMLWFCGPGSARSAERIALVIGNDEYPAGSSFPVLKNCVNDAKLVSKTLKGVGFEVIEIYNADLSTMDDALTRFEGKITKGGTALIYFAGHGIEFEKKNYLMASNAMLQARSRLTREAMEAEVFATAMLLAGAKSSFLLLDCCREKPPEAEWAGRGRKESGLAEISVDGDLVISMAAAPGKQALEPAEAGRNSPYAEALAKWIPSGLKHRDVFAEVRKEVFTTTEGLQRPWDAGSFIDDFYFAQNQPPQDDTAAKLAAMQAKLEEAERKAAAALAMNQPAPAKPSEAPPTPVAAPTMSRPATPPVSPNTGSFGTAPATTRGFTNTLGMTFLPVPGTDVLFCEHETRVMDYAKYASENPGIDMEWKNYEYEGHKQAPDHPVVKVSWEDARAFCAWLGKKDGRLYRLPTDHEWSIAVGIGGRENASASPEDKDNKIEGYPWGSGWPPPNGAGNFSGAEVKAAFDFTAIDGYRDSHAFTAPVKSYNVGKHGLYDMSGNVWEWCEDLYSKSNTRRVLRGGSWGSYSGINLRSSCRNYGHPTLRGNYYGFRCVVSAAR